MSNLLFPYPAASKLFTQFVIPQDLGITAYASVLATSQDMLSPGCICPVIGHDRPDFVEAAVYMMSKGALAGQYVASCAQDAYACGYFGATVVIMTDSKSLIVPTVFLERIFNCPGVPGGSG